MLLCVYGESCPSARSETGVITIINDTDSTCTVVSKRLQFQSRNSSSQDDI